MSSYVRRASKLLLARSTSTPAHRTLPQLLGAGLAMLLVTSTAAARQGSCAGQEMYVSTSSGTIYRVNDYASSPSASLVAEVGLMGITDLAYDPLTGRMLGVASIGAAMSGRELYELDISTQTATFLGALSIYTNALDFSATGELYARGLGADLRIVALPSLQESTVATGGEQTAGDLAVDLDGTILATTVSGDIDRADLDDGSITVVSNVGLQDEAYGLEVDCNGVVYLITSVGGLYTVDVNAGVLNLIGFLGLVENVYGMTFTRGADSPVGSNYCVSTFNSTGSMSTISGNGSSSIAANDLTLLADGLPPQPGIFIAGPAPTQVPFFNGFLCISPQGLQRFTTVTLPSGGITGQQVDLDTSAAGGLNVAVGQPYHFQRWNRDPAGGGGAANFSDALVILYAP